MTHLLRVVNGWWSLSCECPGGDCRYTDEAGDWVRTRGTIADGLYVMSLNTPDALTKFYLTRVPSDIDRFTKTSN